MAQKRRALVRLCASACIALCLLLACSSRPAGAQSMSQEDAQAGFSQLWQSDGQGERNETACTCESPCDLNSATFEDLRRLLGPLRLIKTSGVDGDVSAYNQIKQARPLCNVMELATIKKIHVQPGYLAPPPRPNPGYLLLALWGCGGNQGLYGTVGGRGGCCPVTASSIYCGLKKLFGTKALNRNTWTKAKPDPSCDYSRTLGYNGANPPPWCYTNDRYITFQEMSAVAAGLNETDPAPVNSQWSRAQMKIAFTNLDKDGDQHISEKEYLAGMGLAHLGGGLPRASFVREPWERTRGSARLQERLQKCVLHFGPEKCIGRNPVRSLTVDVDFELEERKKYPDCEMFYQKGSYERVFSGMVCCAQATWEWLDNENNWRPLIRGECVNNPEYTTLTRGLQSKCLEDVSDRRNGRPELPTGVVRQTEGQYGGSRRRAWQRVKPVSEIVQERFLLARARMKAVRASGASVVPTTTFKPCLDKKDKAPCDADPNCAWQVARMPHDAECRSVWDIGAVLDRDQLYSYQSETQEDVLFDVRDLESVEMDPPTSIQTELRSTFWNAGETGTYPLWWREMLAWLKQHTVPSEPSKREAHPTLPQCRGRVGLIIFLKGDAAGSAFSVAPRPRDLNSGQAVWGGVHKLRQKMHYPRWVKNGESVRCGCYPPPLNTMPDIDLYPGCAATENVCLTPPDWSMHS